MPFSRKPSLVPARILLVDDNRHGNVARKTFLEAQGYAIEIAHSGEEAWERCQACPFDVVVTDLRMAGMDGLALIDQIRRSGQLTWTVLLSGFAGPLGLTEEATGADAVLCKGASELEHLQLTLAQLLAKRNRRKPVVAEKSTSPVAHAARSV